MAGNAKRVWNPHAMYDLTVGEQKAIQERAKMREAYRAEWQKRVTNPFRGVGGTIFDPQVMRWNALKATGYEQFRATPKSAAIGFSVTILPITLLYLLVNNQRTTRENKWRNGEVDYKDRDWKFI
ncbi:unnamed protein product [Owenia fusiformis]|uniref:NADH dehydrogenase [ubiquinone] 1 beta subcomplex subunit 4 n=1 Tax=Owenia fusiformis TaxID=6347 RepID=A0A8J1TCB9_OWEFU|nr:unnamed protein product [Owenia fusiformis]